MLALSLFLIGVILCAIYLNYYFHRKQSPPGPLGIPVFGNLISHILWSTKRKHHHFFNYLFEQKEEYGEISSMIMGQQTNIIFHSIEAAREAFVQNGDVFSGRPTSPFFRALFGNSGVVGIDGEKWKNQRRFTIHTMRNFGFGKKSLEPAIVEEGQYIVSIIKSFGSESVNTRDVFMKGVANIISVLLFNKRWRYDDPVLEKYMHSLHKFTNLPGIGALIPAFFPILGGPFFMKRIPATVELFDHISYMRTTIGEQIKDHLKHFDKENEPRDFIEVYLKEMTEMDEKYGKGSHDFDIEQLTGLCFDLFAGGTDTTTNSLAWAIFMLSIYPDMQKKLCKEIDAVVTLDKGPEMSHKKEMVYTQAFMDEVSRYCTVLPHSVDKRVMKPTIFRNFKFRTTDNILTNIYAIHRDPKLWEQPEEFLPERFIDDSGKYKPSENLIPFGIGKRQCLGESLARMEYFLILVYIMQRFEVSLDPEYLDKLDDIHQGTEGGVHAPGLHKIIFKDRL